MGINIIRCLMRKNEWRWNPFSPRTILVANEASESEIEEKEPMSWEDAAKLALIITLTQIFVAFLTLWPWDQLIAQPEIFVWDLIRFSGATFLVTFGSLIGISAYYAGRS